MSDTLHKLLEAIYQAETTTSKRGFADQWDRILELASKLLEEMAR